MSIWLLYLLTRCEHVEVVLEHFDWMLFAAILIWSGAGVPMAAENVSADWWKIWQYGLKLLIPIFVACNLLSVLVPTNKDLYIIVGGYYATNNKEAIQIPDNVLGAVNNFLKEYKAEEIPTAKTPAKADDKI